MQILLRIQFYILIDSASISYSYHIFPVTSLRYESFYLKNYKKKKKKKNSSSTDVTESQNCMSSSSMLHSWFP